jgi:signal transduction histidine kinase
MARYGRHREVLSMHAEDETHAGRPLDPLDLLRHDLRSPLTTIRGRAYLLARAVRRAPSLTEEERTRMLDGVAAIETAVAAMVAVIEGLDGDRRTLGGDTADDRS